MSRYILITGASAGIGADMARRFAADGHHLILAARRRERLQELADRLHEAHGIGVEIVACDLASAEGVAELAGQVERNGWRLDGLVNNAGFGTRGPFAATDRERQLSMIDLNVRAPVDLTHRLLPNLEQGQAPFIINVASLAAFQPGPDMAIYYASKAFVLSFSESLTEELNGRVQVSALCPGATESEFFDEAGMRDTLLVRMGTMDSTTVADTAVANRRRAIVIPGWMNKLTVWLGKLTPRWLLRKIAYRLNR